METLIKQEWYLTHMGDSNFIPPTPTDPNDPLADLSLSITGMTLLEVDEHGKLYDWVKQNYQGE
ncbi:hypothetical protein ACRXCV_00085 (plasmid) [Halobacteriovorax sp. GFR7]|uniref:hypothetical protein n=1 Tax=unclassified Halobacteriovorax TaxID=2639665 RepID=UPI003D97AA6B